jgi:phosphosulfolactate phosphohydrolase-like enzyme
MASQTTPNSYGARVTPKNANTRTVAADKLVQQGRLAKAKQFLQVADDARELSDGEDVADASVTLYVHAGIAAEDAICAGALGKHAKGQDHQDAVALLASVDKQASSSLSVLLGMKTRAGYGHDPISETNLARAERAARSLVEKALL